VPLATVQKLATCWATEYDWRKVEARLNAVQNFITEVDGLDIHFIPVMRPLPTPTPDTIQDQTSKPGCCRC
jgi:Epoxide hydrolase N terminus